MRRSGTTADKLAAWTVVIQENLPANLRSCVSILSLCSLKGKRQAAQAIEVRISISDVKVANRTNRVWCGTVNVPLNDEQRPHVRVVRGVLGTGYTCVRGIGRAWRNGGVSSSPSPSRTRQAV